MLTCVSYDMFTPAGKVALALIRVNSHILVKYTSRLCLGDIP